MEKKLLGVDFGDARTGLAMSDLMGFLATACGCIKGGFEKTAQDVAKFAKDNNIGKIVLGHPINMNGTLGPRSEKAQAFAKRLRELTDIEVVLYDERLSTANAHTILNITNTRPININNDKVGALNKLLNIFSNKLKLIRYAVLHLLQVLEV